MAKPSNSLTVIRRIDGMYWTGRAWCSAPDTAKTFSTSVAAAQYLRQMIRLNQTKAGSCWLDKGDGR